MSIRYHITPSKQIKICKAQPGKCPFASEEEHFDTEKEAEDFSLMSTEIKAKFDIIQELRDELHYLQNVREREVAQKIKEARSFGDLAENSKYDEAKIEQSKLYNRVAEIKDLIIEIEAIN